MKLPLANYILSVHGGQRAERRWQQQTGFTLIELLVVLAIIGVLIGLLVPAVQRVRDSAARIRCANNLHQIGVAVHQYHDAEGALPPGMRYQNGNDQYLLMSWLTEILPYIEQKNLWSTAVLAYSQTTDASKNPPHIGLTTVIPTYTCPADPRLGEIQLAKREKVKVALTSYLGVAGKDFQSEDGVLFRDSHIRFVDITDGLSATLLSGERPPSTDFQFGWSYAGAGQQFTGSTDTVLGVEERNALSAGFVHCPAGPFAFGAGDLSNQCDMFHFWSCHYGGGANFVFADGSVRFLTYSAAPIMPALASRAGGEAVEAL